MAQDKILIHQIGGTEVLEVSDTDSAYFNSDHSIIYFTINGITSEFAVNDIDSITFEPVADSTVSIEYNGTAATVINPLENAGVDVTVNAADVCIYASAAAAGVSYVVSGTTDDGMLKFYFEESFNLLLNNADITINDGPAVNIQSKKKAWVNLVPGTLNTLTDGLVYADPAVEGEDQKAAFFSEGEMIFNSSGSLVIHGKGSDQHAIRSDEYIRIIDGNITVSSAVKDGIHGKEGLFMNGGTVSIASSGDGVDGNEGIVEITGGILSIHSSDNDVNAILTFIDGFMTLSNSGSGGKGIITDGDLVIGGAMTSPVIDVTTSGNKIQISSGGGGGGPGPPGPGDDGKYDKAKTVKSDGSVVINSGRVSVSSSDDGFNATYGNGGEQNDGSQLSINGGYCYLSASEGDPVDSNGNISIAGGTTVVHGPRSDPEVGMDVNGSCIISGGFLVISGTNSNMTEGASNSSTQNSLLVRSNNSIPADTIFRIEDEYGTDIVTFAPSRTYYSIVFSSPDLTVGTAYTIYTGGTCTGEDENGLYTRGTYTGGSFRKSFVTSGTVTNVSL